MDFFSIDIIFWIIAFIPSIVLHELAHALCARWLGDRTAELNGRITLDPRAHLDVVGTLMLFFLHIGWAKPVPVNPFNFKNPRRDMALTSIAGPFANFLIALISGFILSLLFHFYPHANLIYLFRIFLMLNVSLMLFNLIPVPPLDGSKILAYFIPKEYHYQYDRYLNYGPIVLIILILFNNFFPILTYLIGIPAIYIVKFILLISGVS